MSLDGLCSWIEHSLALELDANSETDVSAKKPAWEDDVGRSGPDAVAPPTPKVLIHCLQGMSRSGAIIVAYLMWKHSLDYKSALELARQSRSVITPNSGFADQLRLWEKMGYSIYSARHIDEGDVMGSTKPEYEEWRSNRGILLSRGQEEKQKVVMKSMADMAASFGQQRLQLKSEENSADKEKLEE